LGITELADHKHLALEQRPGLVVAKGGNYAAQSVARLITPRKLPLKTLATMLLVAPCILLGMIPYVNLVKKL
jgi:hypothetical protein